MTKQQDVCSVHCSECYAVSNESATHGVNLMFNNISKENVKHNIT